jgi:superfamily II DNA or RNA helicase
MPSVAQLVDTSGLTSVTDAMSLERGAAYARQGRVEVVEDAGVRVRANVWGSSQYEVELSVLDGVLAGQCSCPVGENGAFCKHCVAAALTVWSGAAPTDEPSGPRFERDGELAAFLAGEGMPMAGQLGAAVLLPHIPEPARTALHYVLSQHALATFATAQALRRNSYALVHAPRMRELLPPAARAFLEAEAERTRRAREELPARCERPTDPALHGLFEALLALRERHPTSATPRMTEALAQAHLAFSAALPGFRWTDTRPWTREALAAPRLANVELRLPPAAAEAQCGLCTALCEHTLAATDAALVWLKAPPSEGRQRALHELGRPAWERSLAAMGRALDDVARDDGAEHVSWRVDVDPEGGIRVEPWLHRLTRKGTLNAGSRAVAARLLTEHTPALTPADRRVAALLAQTSSFAQMPLLRELVGHPHVYLRQQLAAPLSVESAKIGLLADHRGDSVVLVPALDGAPLPPHLLEPQGPRVGGEPVRYLFEAATRRLTLLELPEEVSRTLEALAAYGNDFPPESHAALVQRLSELSARVPVAMPRTVMGETLAPQTHAVLRLELWPDGTIRAEVRIRPLPESASFLPGEGTRDVHVRRGEKPFHTRRDLAAELSRAEEWMKRLPLMDGERAEHSEGAFVALLPGAQRALAFLADLDALEPKPELEWLGVPLKLVGRAQATALKVSLERRRDWFGAAGGLSMDGERVTLAVLLDAGRRKHRFVPLDGGRYVELTDTLREKLERLSDHAYPSAHGVEVGPSAVDALHDLAAEGAKVDADAAWRRLSERIFSAREVKPRIPSALHATLRDYQAEGFRWLARLAAWGAGAVLADDMGLGKTVQALALLLLRAKEGPALVLAPTSVGFNWVDEARRFAPSLRFHVYADTEDRGGALASLGPRDVLVASYGLLARDAGRLTKVPFATIVFDEAQALKNALAQRTKAARELQGTFKLALSGTPLENHLGELWSVYRIVFPGLLGSWDAFRDRFAIPIEKRIDPTAAPALSRVLAPFLLRRTKGQVARELPRRTEQIVPVVLSPAEWRLYEDARLAALAELEGGNQILKEQQRRIQVLASLTRLRLLASHPRLYEPKSQVQSSKLKRMLELLDVLREEGHRALVFSQFTSHLALVREVLDERGASYLYLDGRTPRQERAERVRAFQEGDAPLFLISLKAGGFGLNLTGADNVIHLDPWWNPAVEDQASDRAHRIGQHRPVTIYRLVSKGTIEEQILALHKDKRALVEGVLDGKHMAGRLSSRELLELLSAPAAKLIDREISPGEMH